MKEKTRDSYFIINLIASILASALSYGISFFLTPYMVKSVGSEAYGFVGLANNMVNYASIVTIALNSVAGRFITIKIHEGRNREANSYFNSVFWADMLLALISLVFFVPLIWRLEYIIHIPENLTSSVKLLFLFVVINFLITVVSNVFSVAAFVKNMLYLSSIGNCASALLRVVLLITLFGIFPANIAYISIAASIGSIALAVYNSIVTKRLLPVVKLRLYEISLASIKEMLAAGIWSSVIKLSQVLSDGLDLLICNLGVSSYAMGQLSIAYTIPTIISGIIGILTSLFNPQQTYYYARGETEHVIRELKTNMKFCGFFVSILFVGIIVYGYEFFSLWVPGENIRMIYMLSCLSIVSVLVSAAISALHSVFLLTNKLKVNSLIWFGVSCLDAFIVIFLLQTTDLGVYAVAGVSKIVGILVNFFYTPIYASKCLSVPKKTFYSTIVAYMLDTVLLLAMSFLIKQMLFPVENILYFVGDCILLGMAGCVWNYMVFLNKEEKARMKQTLFRKQGENRT